MAQTDFLELVVETLEQVCGLPQIRLDALVDGGLYAAFDPGYDQARYYDRSGIRLWPVSFMAKNADQETCIRQLDTICTYLQCLRQYPQGAGFRWLNADVANYPSRVVRQEDGQYIYSCTVHMQVYC